MRRRVGPLLRFPIESCNQFSIFSCNQFLRMLLISATFLLPLATFSPWRFQNTLELEILEWLSKRSLAQKIEGLCLTLIPVFSSYTCHCTYEVGCYAGVMWSWVGRLLIFWEAELQIFWWSTSVFFLCFQFFFPLLVVWTSDMDTLRILFVVLEPYGMIIWEYMPTWVPILYTVGI